MPPFKPKVFELGTWTPDAPDMAADGVVVATNCMPSAHGYIPMKAYVSQSTALTARAQGAITTRQRDDTPISYAGDATKLYEYVSSTWTDRSKVGGYGTLAGDQWEFIQWRNQMFATNYTNNPQKVTLAATPFSDLTTALRIKHWDVVRQFIVAGFTEDGVDGIVPWRVRWSGFNDPTAWTPDPATMSDYEDLAQHKIQRVFGGEFGIIMQDNAIHRMSFVGPPVVFQFDEVLPDLGLIAPGAAARIGEKIYFLSERGFHVLSSGTQVDPIGNGLVDRTVLLDLDASFLYRMTAVADPNGQRVWFSYAGAQNSLGTPNKLLCYDIVNNKWSIIEQQHEMVWVGAGAATTLEDLDTPYPDIDAMDISLDSDRWLGGNEQLAIFFTDHKHGFFDGAKMSALITTREYMFDGAQRSRLRGFRPLVEGTSPTITGRVRYRQNVADTAEFTSTLSPNTGGRICCRTNARFHGIELTVGGEWDQAFGIMVESRDLGPGGRRG